MRRAESALDAELRAAIVRCGEAVSTSQQEQALAFLVAQDAQVGAEIAVHGQMLAAQDLQAAGRALEMRTQEMRLVEEHANQRYAHESERARQASNALADRNMAYLNLEWQWDQKAATWGKEHQEMRAALESRNAFMS